MSVTLTIPSDAGHAPASLLAQIYLQPYLDTLTVEQGTELSLSPASTASSEFLPIFKSLLAQAGQAEEATRTGKASADIEKWISAATAGAQDLPLKELDAHLANKTYIAEDGKLSAADAAVFAKLQPYMASASHETLLSHPNVTRHFDLLQHTTLITTALAKLSPNSISSAPVAISLDDVPLVERKYESSKKDKKKDKDAAAAAGTGVEQPAAGGKGKGKAAKSEAAAAAPAPAATAAAVEGAKSEGVAKDAPAGAKKEKKEKAKKEGGAPAEGGKPAKKEKSGGGGGGSAAAVPEELTPGLIDLRVGLIVDVEKHPDADSLYVEKIDVGEAEPRTVVSGLVNYIPIEQMRNKYLVAVCNLKPASMRGIKSYAMVLAATSADGKGGPGSVELVAPPEGSAPGDRVYFEGFEEVKPLEQLPPKKKIFETIQPNFTTLESRDAAWKDPKEGGKVHVIKTEKGVCKAPTFVGASLS